MSAVKPIMAVDIGADKTEAGNVAEIHIYRYCNPVVHLQKWYSITTRLRMSRCLWLQSAFLAQGGKVLQ